MGVSLEHSVEGCSWEGLGLLGIPGKAAPSCLLVLTTSRRVNLQWLQDPHVWERTQVGWAQVGANSGGGDPGVASRRRMWAMAELQTSIWCWGKPNQTLTGTQWPMRGPREVNALAVSMGSTYLGTGCNIFPLLQAHGPQNVHLLLLAGVLQSGPVWGAPTREHSTWGSITAPLALSMHACICACRSACACT